MIHTCGRISVYLLTLCRSSQDQPKDFHDALGGSWIIRDLLQQPYLEVLDISAGDAAKSPRPDRVILDEPADVAAGISDVGDT